MKEKKSISLKLILIIWLIICYVVTLSNIISKDINVFYDMIYFKEKLVYILISMFGAAIKTIFNNWWLLGVIVVLKKITKKVKRESLSKIDLKGYEGIYRDILNKYTPAEIEYIDNLSCDTNTTIIATLLKLELIKKIKIDNDKLIIIDSNTDGLKKTEKYILNSIKDGKVKIQYSKDIEKYAKEEALEDELVEKFKFNDSNSIIKKRIITLIIVFIIFTLGCNFIEYLNIIENSFINFVLTILFIGLIIYLIYAIFLYPKIRMIYVVMKKMSYIRTAKGEEINEKIEGLKNYIAQYSFLETKQKEELVLWEDYLIYSVIFKQNIKVINEMLKLIEIEYEVGKIYFSR